MPVEPDAGTDHDPHMTDDFTPRLDILPKAQRRLWDELGAVPREFVLYGGTAVTLHLAHRQSVDFNFFGSKAFDPATLAAEIPFMARARITQREPNTLSGIDERGGPVRLSFFVVPRLPRLAPPHIASDNGLQVAALARPRRDKGKRRAASRRGEGLWRHRCHTAGRPHRPADGIGGGAGDLWRNVQSTDHSEGAISLRGW